MDGRTHYTDRGFALFNAAVAGKKNFFLLSISSLAKTI